MTNVCGVRADLGTDAQQFVHDGTGDRQRRSRFQGLSL